MRKFWELVAQSINVLNVIEVYARNVWRHVLCYMYFATIKNKK